MVPSEPDTRESEVANQPPPDESVRREPGAPAAGGTRESFAREDGGVDGTEPGHAEGDGGERASRWRGLILVAFAIGSVALGFALGRSLRAQSEPATTFENAAAPTLVAGSASLGGDHPLLGAAAPPIRLPDVDTGSVVSLSDYAGRPVLVNFWATWCPPCRLEMPWLQAAAERHADSGLVVLGVNAGERMALDEADGAIRVFKQAYGLTFPVLHGSGSQAVQDEWGVWGLPASFLVDRSGRVVDAQIGVYPSQDDLERRLNTLVQMR